MISIVPFDYLAHFLTVPVVAGHIEARFIFDTGIGINLISSALAEQAGCAADGTTFTGRRMSGQEVSTPMGMLPSLRLGGLRQENVPAGILDLSQAAGLEGVDGFLSLGFFRTVPVTVDYPAGQIIIEDERSAADRATAGSPVPVEVRRDGPATDVHLPLDLPGGRSITAEVDTGSDSLILAEHLAGDLGIDLGGQAVRTQAGTDETGQEFTRYFTTLPGAIRVSGAPQFSQAEPAVMFQKIIYEGLIGNQFLRNFVVTYDLASARMIFVRP